MSRINVTNAQLLEEIRALRNEINGLKETQALLLRHLAPLFPRVGTDPVNTNEAIDTATRDGKILFPFSFSDVVLTFKR